MDEWDRLGNFLDNQQDTCSCSSTDLDKVDAPQTKGRSAYEFLLEGFDSACIFVYACLRFVALGCYAIKKYSVKGF
jgi:hypothetical protein